MLSVGWSEKPSSWFEAQAYCRNAKQSLTLSKNQSSTFYWTGFYKRTSNWIKIIGCYSSSLHDTDSRELSISSPLLCQEYCFEENIHMFAVKESTCVCLNGSFDDSKNRLNSSECSYKCDNTTLLSTECGGESAYSVFLTDNFMTWTAGKENCNKNNSYLLWNIDFSDLTSTCKGLDNKTDQRWIGIVKEKYMNTDHGQDIEDSDQDLFNTCQKCRKTTDIIECQYVRCDEKLPSTVFCTESTIEVTHLPETTYKTTKQVKPTIKSTQQIEATYISTSRPETSHKRSTLRETTVVSKSPETITNDSTNSLKESSNDGVIVPVVIISFLLLGSVVAIVMYMYIRKRKKKLQEKVAKGKETPTVETENYSRIENTNDKNYFVLQRSNPTYQLADSSGHELESPYNEAEDGTYDHLGNSNARKIPIENSDLYNHAFSAELSDLSDYDIANHKRLKEDDITYDHTDVGENSYGHFCSTQNKECDYSKLS